MWSCPNCFQILVYTIPEIPIFFVIVIYLLFYLEIDAFTQTLMIVCFVNIIVIDWIFLSNTEKKTFLKMQLVCSVADADAIAS